MRFEWDEEKAARNTRKHRVGFEEGATVFGDPLAVTIRDPDPADDEERFVDIGYSDKHRLLVVVYTEGQQRIRIVSCREATRTERKAYEESPR